jgi:hypothetical protein
MDVSSLKMEKLSLKMEKLSLKMGRERKHKNYSLRLDL